MLYFMVFMWVLCVGEIVHCENDLGPDYIGYNAGLGKNKLNFGYGVNFKFNGKVHNNLDRVWVVKRFNLPQELNLQFKGLNFVLNCTYDNLTKSVKHDLGQFSRLNFIKEICRQTQTILKQLSQGAFQYQHVLKRLIQGDLYHALHSLSIIDELRFKRYTKTDKHSHDPLLASTHVEEEDIQNYDKANVKGRNKRGLVAFLPLIGKIATIAAEALGSHLQRKRQKAMIKAVNEMQSKRFLTRNELHKLEKDFLMYGEYDVQTTDGVIHVLQNLNNRTAYLESMINGQNINAMLQYISDSRGIEIYSHQVNLYVQAMRERYLRPQKI